MSKIKKFKEYIGDKISNSVKKVGDAFSIICDNCGERMKEEYYIPGVIDSIYYKCPKCGKIYDGDGDDNV